MTHAAVNFQGLNQMTYVFDVPFIIPTLAAVYLMIVYLLLTLIGRIRA